MTRLLNSFINGMKEGLTPLGIFRQLAFAGWSVALFFLGIIAGHQRYEWEPANQFVFGFGLPVGVVAFMCVMLLAVVSAIIALYLDTCREHNRQR